MTDVFQKNEINLLMKFSKIVIIFDKILYNFDQFVSHMSQGYLTKQNLVLVTGHKAT
jgi:hypothetical protein